MSQQEQLLQWVNQDLRLSKNISNINQDFGNGFLFKEVLNKLGYNFQDLNKIINNQEINSQNKNNNVFEQFTSTVNKNNDKHLQSSFKSNTFTKTQLPRKILEIEEKLEKFREEKIKHEIIAKQQFEQDQILDWELKQEFRQQELEKLRANKTYMKDVEQRIYQNWQKTEMDKKARQDKEKQFQDFMTGKILKKIQDQRDLDEDEFVNGVKYFKKNAQRQGIELKHNPEEEKREVKKPKFNPQTTLAKIKERTQQQIEARKLKQKRQNKMMVDQLIQTEIVEQKKLQADFLEKVFNNSIQCNQEGWKQVDTINKEQIISDNRLLASEKFNTDLNEYFRQQQLEQKQNQEEKQRIREKEIRQRDLEYMQINLDRKINKRKKHNKICENTLDQILDLVDICFKHQQKNNSQQLEQSYWDDMLKKFINNKLFDNQQSVDLFQQEKNQLTSNLNLDESDQIQKKQAEDEFKQYFSAQKIWNAVHEFPEGKEKFNSIDNNDYLGNFLTEIVDNLHPKQEKTQIPQEIPNYLPLKLSMIGLPFSGKKTLANLLKQKYQLELIDPKQIIQQAHELAFPPPEDDKNKKKGAKKDTKKKGNAKDQEEEKPVNPELIELGQKVHEFIENNLEIPDEFQVQAAIIQIKELFPLLTNEELVEKIQNWNEAEEQRQANILKEQEEALKKNAKKPAKAPAKKGAKEQPVTEEKPEEKSEQELLQEKIKEKKPFGYSQGYVLLNFPLNIKQAKLLEKQLIGFVTEDERLNPKAEEKKKIIGQLVKQKETPPDTTLKQSGIDLYIYLDNNQEEVVKRADGRRIDPTTETVYHLDYNPPTDPKIKDRLQELPAESENIKKFEEQLDKEKEPLFNYLQIFGIEGAYQAFSKINTQESLLQSYLNLENLIQQVLIQKRPDLEEKVENQQKLEQQQQQLQEEQQKQEEIQNQENQEKEQQETNQENGEQVEYQNKNSEKNNQEVSQKSNQSVQEQEQQQQEEENEKDIKSPLDILNQQQMEELIKIWDDVQIQYVKDLQSAFINIDDHRQSVDQKSEDLQNRFLQIVEKQDDKQEKIDQYVQSYNRFYQESGQIMKFQNAKNEIQIHLDEVYESLWDSIENKKNLAQLERKNITCSGWIESEMEKVFGQFFRIYQIEINKLHEIVEMFYFILDTLENKPINEVQEHVVLEPDFKQLLGQKQIKYQFIVIIIL
ncbi:Calponin homology domain [Pseudocohnilembus persalinus]|uniref:Calponin homology domain n=1 Tax=Pseudocohnilembus persalinus TaxID=266149 RepID=A0A0V0QQ15_PSEPJ|nr:Calponin homology domain [Pseudocohnilembus persalinus]|eukprot:KRX04379.1 Calponin homology domain [Pseudocohnilembus persalinus]